MDSIVDNKGERTLQTGIVSLINAEGMKSMVFSRIVKCYLNLPQAAHKYPKARPQEQALVRFFRTYLDIHSKYTLHLRNLWDC